MHATANDSLINLSKDVKIVLAKRQAPTIVAQVSATFDLSGSATSLYERGTMQRTANRCYALAYQFDDNKVLESWGFHNSLVQLEPITEAMFGDYTDKYIYYNDNISKWGGTRFRPVVDGIVEFYYPSAVEVVVEQAVVKQPGFFGKMFGAKEQVVRPARIERQRVARDGLKLDDPAYAMIITDGENSDEAETERALAAYTKHHVFFQFIGIRSGTRANFGFIQRMAEKFPNVGFFDADLIDELSNQDLYDQVLSKKFINWYTNVKAA